MKTSVFYLDTEGFESIGKSNVYDDRLCLCRHTDLVHLYGDELGSIVNMSGYAGYLLWQLY